MRQKMLHQIRRSFHATCLLMARKKSKPIQAGIRHQLAAQDNAPDLTDNPEDLEDLEADFMQVNRTHRQHESELIAQRDQVRHIMVKNKYFPEPRLPNFLLYAEKEEIRNLHAQDPEEWTIERLAESFPANPEIVKKILNSKWRPYSIQRIRKHDEVVIRNWQLLKDGERNDLPNELREHLSKFGNRTFNHIPTMEYKETLFPKLPKPRSNEFTSIITSCKKYAEREQKESEPNYRKKEVQNPFKSKVPDPEKDSFFIGDIEDTRRMRLEDWQKENMTQFKQLEDTSPKYGNNEEDEETKTAVAPFNQSGSYIEKFESKEIVVSAEDTRRYEMSSFKERVHIPRRLWRKGYTYRVEDCYYDDDGEFLYRVPGMSGKQQQTESKKNGSS